MEENKEAEDLMEVVKDPRKVKLERRIKSARRSVWVLAIIIILNTAAAIFIGQLYERPDYNNGRSDISSALSSYQTNDASSTTVYQQMVTNGWVARDLLESIGNQNVTLIEQASEANWVLGWLLFNILFTLGWLSIALIRIGLTLIEIQQARLE